MFSLLIDPPSTVNFNSCLVSTGSRKVSMDITGSSIKQHRENQTSVTTVTNTLLTDFIILQHNDNVSVLLLKLNSLINKGIIVNMWGWHDDLLIPTQRSQTQRVCLRTFLLLQILQLILSSFVLFQTSLYFFAVKNGLVFGRQPLRDPVLLLLLLLHFLAVHLEVCWRASSGR